MPTSIELFAGAGGMALGVHQAGFQHSLVVELDQAACDTIRANQQSKVIPAWDVKQEDVHDLCFKKFAGKLDLLSAGPPCQPFSQGGKSLGRGDHRDLFPETIRAIRESNPKAFIIENVKGLEWGKKSNYLEYVKLQLQHPFEEREKSERWDSHRARLEERHTGGDTSPHYNLIARSLNTADYGVPQHRQRIILVGVRSDVGADFSFPDPTHSFEALVTEKWVTKKYWDRLEVARKSWEPVPPKINPKLEAIADSAEAKLKSWVSVREALNSLPTPASGESSISQHNFIPGARVYEGHTGSRMDQPAKALKAGSHGVPGGENMMVLDNGSVRYFTIRECARLQTFPDTYQFSGKWARQVRQLGNAVPVRLSQIVSSALAQALNSTSRNIKNAPGRS